MDVLIGLGVMVVVWLALGLCQAAGKADEAVDHISRRD
jgi:hypothetical protein